MRALSTLIAFGLIGLDACAQDPEALDLDPDAVRPGLVGVYRSLVDQAARVTRVVRKPAFFVGHSSPHPRLPAGPFEVTWTGVVLLKDPGPITFDAFVGGSVAVSVGGVEVLKGSGASESAHVTGNNKLSLEPGLYRLQIRYRSLAKVPARLQIFWQSPAFSKEPLPGWQLYHHRPDAPKELERDSLAARGRLVAGKLGCARCHEQALPGLSEPPPGPALSNLGQRVTRDWLLRWLDDPAGVHADARMPGLFTADRKGRIERTLIADHLLGNVSKQNSAKFDGDHRMGHKLFANMGCAACHPIPDLPPGDQDLTDRHPLRGLGDRFTPAQLAGFLANPLERYPDGRMPRLPITPNEARDIAAYLLLWNKATVAQPTPEPTDAEVQQILRGLGARDRKTAGQALLEQKRCVQCHPGLGNSIPARVPVAKLSKPAGCVAGDHASAKAPRFAKTVLTDALKAYLEAAALEKHASPFADRQRQLERAGCMRCHQRDSAQPPPLETISSILGGAYLQYVPYQRTPRLTHLHQKYHHDYLLKAVREGVSGLRHKRYSFRMPAFGKDAPTLLQALAEADGEVPGVPLPEDRRVEPDPTLATLQGSLLAGFQGYSCVSCHVWNGEMFAQPDPGAVGTDLTRVAGRIRKSWFTRFLENPGRFHPGTPMPAIFIKGKKATLTGILDGDPDRQREALWAYFALGTKAPSPKPPPPLVVAAPRPGEEPLTAHIPIRLPGKEPIESITVLFSGSDMLLYDLASGQPAGFLVGANLLRTVEGRLRTFVASGTSVWHVISKDSAIRLMDGKLQPQSPRGRILIGFDRLPDGIAVRWRLEFSGGKVHVVDTLRVQNKPRLLTRELVCTDVPEGHKVVVLSSGPVRSVNALLARPEVIDLRHFTLPAARKGKTSTSFQYALPAMVAAKTITRTVVVNPAPAEGSLARPGYRAMQYATPRSASGEDLLMPSALAVHPRDGRVFVASMKMGEVFVVNNPKNPRAQLADYTRGRFQEAYSMLAEEDSLYVLHRRNLTKLIDADKDGVAERFERVLGLKHSIADKYDYAYGLVRDRHGSFVLSHAPHANRGLPGSGSALSWQPGKQPREIAFGFRNPLGWCVGPDSEIFFTDNQGEWVATNKLCHLVEGRFYGFPNREQEGHAKKPHASTTIWVPYAWARSINGVAYDHTAGKFGPFAGQVFLAELMYGGAIVRANLEKVNGVYQGACFPFWGKGLLGPVVLAFDPRGPLYVGSITEPGWMAQPDRGALYRIDFTGKTPFEMKSIHVLPKGFRIQFTRSVDASTARDLASYRIDFHRYEYTGAYGSPELDKTRLKIERVELSPDGTSAELHTGTLVPDRVYMIEAAGVRSAQNERLVHRTGAYTLNEIPRP